MQFSNASLCYECTQRTYRNAVVRHIRTAFKAKYPTDWSGHLKTTVGVDVWNKNAENDKARQVSGEVKARTSDEFDLLDLSHFYNFFDKYFSVLFPTKTGESGKDFNRRKRAILDWTLTVKTFRDPMSHPPEQDFTFQDTFRMIDCAFRVLEALELPESLQLQNIIADLSAGQPKDIDELTDPLQHSLPPRESVVVDFVGRAGELIDLRKWIEDPHARRWAIAGEGGKGKSAIAYEFATTVRFAPPTRNPGGLVDER